jgi:uncharacterized protein (DUF924 family)
VLDNIHKIISFWFGEFENQLSSPQKSKLWYNPVPENDQFILNEFEHLLEQACHGELAYWMDTAQGAIALVILLDQMPRNMYRGTDKAFTFDHLALKYCLQGISNGIDKQMPLAERCLFYHPLEHAEDLTLQRKCVSLFQRMQQTYMDEEHQIYIRKGLDFAQQHYAIIKHFGRFPHRNYALGRASTVAETVYLQKNSAFGQ